MKRARIKTGFATFMAVVLLSVAAIAAMGLVLMFRIDAERTRRTIAGAQLRQVLLAAAPEVERRFEADPHWPTGPGATEGVGVALPAPLADADITLTLTTIEADDERLLLHATATGGDAFAEQALEYVWADDRWVLAGLRLAHTP